MEGDISITEATLIRAKRKNTLAPSDGYFIHTTGSLKIQDEMAFTIENIGIFKKFNEAKIYRGSVREEGDHNRAIEYLNSFRWFFYWYTQ